MTTRIRLARGGKKKAPYYRIVVADKRSPRDGKFVERIGSYDPLLKEKKATIDLERVQYWLGTGAKPSDRVQKLLQLHGFKFGPTGNMESFQAVSEIAPKPEKEKKPSKKALARQAAAAEPAAEEAPKKEAAAPEPAVEPATPEPAAEESPKEEAAAPEPGDKAESEGKKAAAKSKGGGKKAKEDEAEKEQDATPGEEKK